jgi:hypothetical protein
MLGRLAVELSNAAGSISGSRSIPITHKGDGRSQDAKDRMRYAIDVQEQQHQTSTTRYWLNCSFRSDGP